MCFKQLLYSSSSSMSLSQLLGKTAWVGEFVPVLTLAVSFQEA